MTGTAFSGLLAHDSEEDRKIAAWNKASVVPGHDPNHARKDAFGWWVVWAEYGNRNSPWGWEIDHAIPTILGGGDSFDNLRALHWRVNCGLGGALTGLGR